MSEVRAQLQGVRLAPRKVRALVDLIKKRDVIDAMDQLQNFVRRPAPVLLKLLESALANAENTYNMVRENLYIKEMIVDEGIKLKRFWPRAQGRATEVQKKTSRVKLVLDEKVPGMKRAEGAQKASFAKAKESKESAETDTKTHSHADKPEVKRELGKKGNIVGSTGKKMFNRKSV